MYSVIGSHDFDIDLDPMTLIYEHDLDARKMYPYIQKMNFLGLRVSTIIARLDRQTHRHRDRRNRTHY